MGISYGCVLLAGGRGSRMGGQKKSELIYKGQTMGARIADQIRSIKVPCFYSCRQDTDDGIPEGFIPVRDECPVSLGPIEGIARSLETAAEKGLDGLFAAACDMPHFRSTLVRQAVEYAEQADLVLYETRDGRRHYTCGYYSAACLPAMQSMISAGNLRLQDLGTLVNTKFLKTSEAGVPDYYLMNVNTQGQYECLLHLETRPPVLAVCGYKNSGKTKLLEAIVKRLTERSMKIAVIKHDGHDFEADVPGTDSFRMKRAGAYGTCVFSDTKFSAVKEQKITAEDLLSLFPEADLILLEGLKDSDYPKIEVLGPEQPGKSGSPCGPVRLAADPSTVLAYVGDRKEDEPALPSAARLFRSTDISGICELILRFADHCAVQR